MDNRRLIEIQSQRGAKSLGKDTVERSIESVINECRRYIQDESDSYRDVEPERKRAAIQDLIIKYVMNNPTIVEGYTDSDNKPDTNKLIDKLTEEITDYGILTNAMMNPDIYEIRCNGKEIKVEVKGRVQDLRDKDGHIVSFESVEQQDIILRKMLGDIRLTPKDALVNSRTIEGYRIAAVHSSATSPDPDDPGAPLYHSFVLRKFAKIRMSLADIAKKKTMSDNMARFLNLMAAGGLTFLTVGPTASGKSTTNNAILKAIPSYLRTVLVQNPSEIDLRMKDASGRVINDVLHLEARDFDNPTPNDPTMTNIMAHILRLSPTMVCLGEIRRNEEFAIAMTIGNAGHSFSTTLHASSSQGAISRFLTAYLAVSHEPSELALMTITNLVDIIIVQKIMRDGYRRVIQVSEITGVDPNNPNKPAINDLFRYEIDGEPEIDEASNVVMIHGHHKRVGKLSERTITKFQLEGVSPKRYEFLTRDVDPNEEETYTGENIENFGM